MSVFTSMSRVIREELIAGRISLEEARARLRINVEYAERAEINNKVNVLKSRRISAWDSQIEKKTVLHPFQDLTQ